jgi:hypothetical protein
MAALELYYLVLTCFACSLERLSVNHMNSQCGKEAINLDGFFNVEK